MIDVVFLLIIFFLVASYFVRSEQSRAVMLPDAAKGQSDDHMSQNRLTITV
jgi:biopolymer transport protein ExbD